MRYNFYMAHFFSQFFFGPPFRPFEPAHLIALGLILFLNLLIVVRGQRLTPTARRAARYTLAAVLLAAQISGTAWIVSIGKASLQTVLPLHLCSLMMWLSAYMLLARIPGLFELSYFLGFGAALFALATPDVGQFNFPHFVFFQALIGHGALLTAQVYMAAVEGFRPGRHAVLRVYAALNVYIPLVALVNWLTGANYLFLASKPDFPTPLDVLGPWPWYILSVDAIALAVLFLLNLPFRSKLKTPPMRPLET